MIHRNQFKAVLDQVAKQCLPAVMSSIQSLNREKQTSPEFFVPLVTRNFAVFMTLVYPSVFNDYHRTHLKRNDLNYLPFFLTANGDDIVQALTNFAQMSDFSKSHIGNLVSTYLHTKRGEIRKVVGSYFVLPIPPMPIGMPAIGATGICAGGNNNNNNYREQQQQ